PVEGDVGDRALPYRGARRSCRALREVRPKGVPRPILDRLTDGPDKALDDHNVRKRLVDIGVDIPGKAKRGQQALAALVRSEGARWAPIIKGTIIKAAG